MAGIFGNFMRGYELSRRHKAEEEDRAYQQAEREYLRERRAAVDQREDSQWSQGQEDRTRNLARDAKEYPLRFKALQQGVDSGDLALDDARYRAGRRNIEAGQADNLFNERMAASRQSRDIAAAQNQRQSAMHDAQLRAANIKLDEAELAKQHANFARAVGAPIRRFAITGDTQGLSDAFAGAFGSKGSVVRNDADGTYSWVEPDGDTTPIGDKEAVLRTAVTLAQSPEAWLQVQQQSALAAAGGAQPLSTYGKTVADLMSQFPPEQGESRQDYNDRIRGLYIDQSRQSSDDRFRTMTENVLSNMVPVPRESDEARTARAEAQARQIMSLTLDAQGEPAKQAAPSDGRSRRVGGSPYDEGTQIRGPDGKLYVVQNGVPVLLK